MIKKKKFVIYSIVLFSFIFLVANGWSKDGPPKKTVAALYYALNDQVFKLTFPDQENTLVYAIPKNALPKKMSEIKCSLGKLAWLPGETSFIAFGMEPYKVYNANILYTWDGVSLNAINLKQYKTATSSGVADEIGKEIALGFSDISINDFLFSPDGKEIAWNINRLEKAVQDDQGGTSFVSHDVKIASLNGKNQYTALSEQLTTSGFNADHAESRRLVGWSKHDPDKIYLTTYFERQLYSGSRGLYSLSIKNKQFNTNYSSNRLLLSFSNDEKLAAVTPNDETCCSGSNYTNNTVDILDFSSGKSWTIYNEWNEFNNEASEDEYYPASAFFSPNNDLIAITIAGHKNIVYVKKVHSGKEIVAVKDGRAIGWIDNNRILLGNGYKYNYKNDPTFMNLFIYNISSRRIEYTLAIKNVVVLDMEIY